MPRIKPPPAKAAPETPEIEEYVAPVGAIEIDLPDEPGETHVEIPPIAAAPPAPPPPPEPPPPPVEDNPLQRQLAAQQHAEELQRANAEMQRQLRERDEEIARQRDRGDDAEYNSVLAAIGAEQSAIDKAEADYAAFAAACDWASAGKTQRIIASSRARLDRLEDGKQAFESRRETPKTTPPAAAPPPAQPAPQDFEQRIAQMPEPARGWLRKHPEFI